jgi:hypothetical protein
MNRSRAVPSVPDVVDHLGVPTWRGDCVASAVQILLLDWHEVLPARRITADNRVMDANDAFRVN